MKCAFNEEIAAACVSIKLTQFQCGSYCPLDSEMAKCCCDGSIASWERQCEMAVCKDPQFI